MKVAKLYYHNIKMAYLGQLITWPDVEVENAPFLEGKRDVIRWATISHIEEVARATTPEEIKNPSVIGLRLLTSLDMLKNTLDLKELFVLMKNFIVFQLDQMVLMLTVLILVLNTQLGLEINTLLKWRRN